MFHSRQRIPGMDCFVFIITTVSVYVGIRADVQDLTAYEEIECSHFHSNVALAVNKQEEIRFIAKSHAG